MKLTLLVPLPAYDISAARWRSFIDYPIHVEIASPKVEGVIRATGSVAKVVEGTAHITVEVTEPEDVPNDLNEMIARVVRDSIVVAIAKGGLT